MFTSYYDVRGWLESFIPYTYSKKSLGLERITYFLRLLGNPEDKFKSILVAGTSGKGSTAFYIAQLLRNCERSENSENSESQIIRKLRESESQRVRISDKTDTLTRRHTESSEYSGLKIGLHLSPHLSYIGERMQINGKAISAPKLIRLISQIRLIVDKVKREKAELTPSYFEILVAASFKYFAQEKVDFAVVEVGLGGRLDATNVLQPEICVITNIGLDHTEILGNSIEKIAFEKAGIIKSAKARPFGLLTSRSKAWPLRGVPVVTGATGKALKVIEKVAKAKKAPLIKINTRLGVQPLKSVSKDYLIIYKDIERYIAHSFTSQNKNLALLSVLTLTSLREALRLRSGRRSNLNQGKIVASSKTRLAMTINSDVVKKAFSAGFPGRLEEVDENVILDGAHNPQKIIFLIDFLRKYQISNIKYQIVLVIGFKKGKDWKKMVDLLLKSLPIKKIIATKFQAVTDTGRHAAVETEEIAAYCRRQGVSLTGVYSNSQEAVFKAINEPVILNEMKDLKRDSSSSTQNDKMLVLVTGSLYLVGEARTLWHLPEFS